MSRMLSDAACGETVVVARIGQTNPATRQRLLDMGVTRGAEIMVERLAPLGDPVKVVLKGYHLAIRKSEASVIEIQ